MRLAVLASGSGTILDAMAAAGLPIELVIVDRPCAATEVAAGHGIAAQLIERESYGPDFDREGYTEKVCAALQEADIDLVAMAGYGTILAPSIYDHYAGAILNTHPALLPAFKGWHAVREALAAGVKVTGCTVHVATAAVDDGPILAQEAVTVLEGDTETTLHERIKTVERRLYVDTLRSICRRGSVT
ncbi:MAG: phosphoribosylglycinamide formyltransferase [Acidimicrobiia bacterium]|nr:phosphoribosylglycinamide formyltransferase [Acidimicrobiia bacterium]MDH5238427.1 phosphoribosylglycinamide formyltransferase [Acidimicrobiia bacterium]